MNTSTTMDQTIVRGMTILQNHRGDFMPETIDMSGIISAEMQHEIDAIETSRKWHEWCKKARAEGRIK